MEGFLNFLMVGTIFLCAFGIFLSAWALVVMARKAKEKREREDPDNLRNHY